MFYHHMVAARSSLERDDGRTTLSSEHDFTSLSYQELFVQLQGVPEPMPGYRSYLRRRHFAA